MLDIGCWMAGLIMYVVLKRIKEKGERSKGKNKRYAAHGPNHERVVDKVCLLFSDFCLPV
jgi:hypothetical protein